MVKCSQLALYQNRQHTLNGDIRPRLTKEKRFLSIVYVISKLTVYVVSKLTLNLVYSAFTL